MGCLIFCMAKFSWLVMMIESTDKLSSPEVLSEQIKYKHFIATMGGKEGGIACTVVLETTFKKEWLSL